MLCFIISSFKLLSTHLEKEKILCPYILRMSFSVHMEKDCALINMSKLYNQNFCQKFV